MIQKICVVNRLAHDVDGVAKDDGNFAKALGKSVEAKGATARV